MPKVFKALGIRRFSLGSFSEVPAVFDPEHLKAVVEELAGEQDVIDHLHKPDNTGAKLRVKEALWEKLGYSFTRESALADRLALMLRTHFIQPVTIRQRHPRHTHIARIRHRSPHHI